MRFAATITTVVLAAVLLTESALLLAVQAVVFAIGAVLGVRRSPYAVVFAKVDPPAARPADARPRTPARRSSRRASASSSPSSVSSASRPAPTALGLVAVGLALAAAFLNAVFGLCLGCEVYLLITRIFSGRDRSETTTTEVSA